MYNSDLRSICVEGDDVELTYWDSGAPTCKDYVTIIAMHGFGFSGAVFEKISAISASQNVRFVAVNRRGYAGSTKYSDVEARVVLTGSEKEKHEYIASRGRETLSFIDAFIRRNCIAPSGKGGGVVLLGWSIGTFPILSALAQVDSLDCEKRKLLQSHLKSVILHDDMVILIEPPPTCLGQSLREDYWLPLFDTTMPENIRIPFFAQWVTSYFQHGDLEKQDITALSHIIPAPTRVPTVFSFSPNQSSAILCTHAAAACELPLAVTCLPQLKSSFEKACFSKEIRSLLPDVNIHHLYGDASVAFAIGPAWTIQDLNKRHGGGFIKSRRIEGANHLFFWEEPERALKSFLDCL